MTHKEELIKIETREDGTPAVSGRKLYEFLNVKRDFTSWIKQMIGYGFSKHLDYDVCSPDLVSKGRGGHNKVDYVMTLDMAKEISMIQRNEKGKQARQYFIECESRLKEVSKTTIPDMENIPDEFKPIFQLAKGVTMLAQKQVELSQRLDMLDDKTVKINEHLEHREPEEGSMTLSSMAKELGVYSTSNLPHGALIGAVARKCRVKTGTSHYHEDNMSQTIWTNESGKESLMLYIKPEGQKIIQTFFDEQIAEYVHDKTYSRNYRGHVPGDIKYHYVQFETGPEYKVKFENEL